MRQRCLFFASALVLWGGLTGQMRQLEGASLSLWLPEDWPTAAYWPAEAEFKLQLSPLSDSLEWQVPGLEITSVHRVLGRQREALAFRQKGQELTIHQLPVDSSGRLTIRFQYRIRSAALGPFPEDQPQQIGSGYRSVLAPFSPGQYSRWEVNLSLASNWILSPAIAVDYMVESPETRSYFFTTPRALSARQLSLPLRATEVVPILAQRPRDEREPDTSTSAEEYRESLVHLEPTPWPDRVPSQPKLPVESSPAGHAPDLPVLLTALPAGNDQTLSPSEYRQIWLDCGKDSLCVLRETLLRYRQRLGELWYQHWWQQTRKDLAQYPRAERKLWLAWSLNQWQEQNDWLTADLSPETADFVQAVLQRARAPDLEVNYRYRQAENTVTISYRQGKPPMEAGWPMSITLLTGTDSSHHLRWVEGESGAWNLPTEGPLHYVRAGPGAFFPGDVRARPPDNYLLYQLRQAPGHKSRQEALLDLLDTENINLLATMCGLAMESPYPPLREKALERLSRLPPGKRQRLEESLRAMAHSDLQPELREKAQQSLESFYQSAPNE